MVLLQLPFFPTKAIKMNQEGRVMYALKQRQRQTEELFVAVVGKNR